MPTTDAPLVPSAFDRTTLPSHMRITHCEVCDTPFFHPNTTKRQRERRYCSTACSITAKNIRSHLRKNGYPLDVSAFARNPAAFPRINPLANTKVPRFTIEPPKRDAIAIDKIPDYFESVRNPHPVKFTTTKTPEDVIELNKTQAEKERERSKTARAQARLAEAKNKEREAIASEREAIRSQTEAIQEAREALGLLPLSSQKDVLSGKRAFLPSEDIAKARASINVIVENNLLVAEKVLDGSMTWSPTQVNLFRMFLNKVVPDAAAAKPVEPKKKSIGELTIEELEDMVANAKQPRVVNP